MQNFNIKSFLKEWVIPIAIEILIVLFLLKFVFFLTNVPSGSMIPTIDENSWLFVTRIHNPEKRVDRGDIIVFEGEELNLTLIKRCIGLPGDTVEIDNMGNIFIDGEKLDEPYVKHSMGGEYQRFDVPENSYLFFGDNRSGSNDGRDWNNPYVEKECIIGEAHFTFWPLKNFGFLN